MNIASVGKLVCSYVPGRVGASPSKSGTAFEYVRGWGPKLLRRRTAYVQRATNVTSYNFLLTLCFLSLITPLGVSGSISAKPIYV